MRPNESLRARRERRLAAGREAFPAKVRGVRGAATILQDAECGDTFDAAGPTSVGPGSTVTTVRPRDSRGRPVGRSVQVLPSVALGQAGSASAPDVRRTEIDAAPTLTAADPEVIPAGDTTSVTFIGLGLVEDPLTVIVAVIEAAIDTDDPRITIDNAAWVADPQAQGIAAGFQAISADVTVDAGASPGSLIHYAVEVA